MEIGTIKLVKIEDEMKMYGKSKLRDDDDIY